MLWLTDWQVLGLSHPALNTRDLALFRPLRKRLQGRSVIDLSILVHIYMGRKIGLDYEDSVRSRHFSPPSCFGKLTYIGKPQHSLSFHAPQWIYFTPVKILLKGL